ncbi:PP0621 family protein [Nitrosomonas cryotolerans]|uniref:Preprotein translocase subunit YajC n=1 Tax=Nitrosomonas cryotolerans ATCC 49181 TaxID=1131553 RepID=A0A1N6J4L5_9PROT|nr:PP0621 family protein [Nitrosomonas cryotolerans]SIO39056.1 uncharacterized protein SAMN02743940_2296 [Nitrosomonas cryotolerans ATCC 49181]
MGKLLFIIVVALFIYWMIKGRRRAKKQTEPLPDTIEDMVRCTHCGVHLPKSESITRQDKFFCSDDHYHQHSQS